MFHCIIVSWILTRFQTFMYLFALLDYVKIIDTWCGANVNGNYNDRLDAENACNQKTDCNAFYDTKSENKSFVLCGSPPIMKRSDYFRSSLYTKCTFSIQVFIRKYRKFSISLALKSITIKFIHIIYCLSILGEGEIISGLQIGKPCHFPFLYKGIKYNVCTLHDSPGHPWCASDHEYSTNNFGDCNCELGNRYKIYN